MRIIIDRLLIACLLIGFGMIIMHSIDSADRFDLEYCNRELESYQGLYNSCVADSNASTIYAKEIKDICERCIEP